jgi:hypothetical protein
MKREILVPLILSFLGLLFVIINIILFFLKSNGWLISKKLKVGALILSLSGIFGCGSPPQRSCYRMPPSTEYLDSIKNIEKMDSIKTAENQKRIEDSIAKEEKRKKDSIARKKHIKKDSIVEPSCYKMPPQKTCYAPVKKQSD